MSRPIVVRPGEGARVGNVEFLARTRDTPRFTFGIIDFAAGRLLEAHVHDDEDDAFYVLEGEVTFDGDDEAFVASAGTFVLARPGVVHGFHNHTGAYARLLNIHAPAGFDVRFLADRGGPDADG